jgi:hypothetical protein
MSLHIDPSIAKVSLAWPATKGVTSLQTSPAAISLAFLPAAVTVA